HRPYCSSNTVGFGEQYGRCGIGGVAKAPITDNHYHKLWAYRAGWTWEQAPYFDTRILSNKMAGGSQNPPTACTATAASFALPPENQPTIDTCNPYNMQAMDAGGCVVGMMDGSVRVVNTSVDTTAWLRAMWPKDGFIVGDF